MLEKPDIPDALLPAHLQDDYNLRVSTLTFLPLGADTGTAVYRVIAAGGAAYFLKLRKGFDEISVTVPLFLKSQGIEEIIAPLETKSKRGWADFGEYKLILYPYVVGKDGFERELTDHHRRVLGSAFRGIHTAQLPPELRENIRKETFSSEWRDDMKSYQAQVEKESFTGPTAAKLAEFMKSKRNEITRVRERAEKLAVELQSKQLDLVLCHTDIHGGNILLASGGWPSAAAENLYIVDWDNPLLAPKERDLMFIGGGIDAIWKGKREQAVFYEGYGDTEIDLSALTYYRYERIIEDLVSFCGQLLLGGEGGADREEAYRWFASNFEPGQTIEIAERTDELRQQINSSA